MNRLVPLLALLVLPALAGCELFGESAASMAARREAEGKALGAACRHAARSLEDCFALNKRGDKAAIYAGWREMNDYMRENQIDAVPAQGATTEVAQSRGADAAAEPAPADAGAVGEGKKAAKPAGAKPKQAS